jgi:hypothetical protein
VLEFIDRIGLGYFCFGLPRPRFLESSVPHVLTTANCNSWSVEELNAAQRAVAGPFASEEERRAAMLRYTALMNAKRDSGWKLPEQPINSL